MDENLSLFKYSMTQLKYLFKNTPFLEVGREFGGNMPVIEVKDTAEFLDVCNKLRLLVEYNYNPETGKVRFSANYGGRLLRNEISVEELKKVVDRLVELRESVV